MNDVNYDSGVQPTWCPGCGIFGIYNALKLALKELNLGLDNVCLTYDVGCSSNMANFTQVYGLNGLHGRSLPAACGISLAQHQLPVVAIAGDGGAYGEGLNHFVAACRANYDLTYIVINNQLYALTTGQTSPTTLDEEKTKSTPFGVIETRFNPLATAIINQASFVARGFAGEINHLTQLIVKAIKHPGLGFIDVLSPCVTWHKNTQPFSWYQERVYQLEQDGYPQEEALKLALEEPDKLALGVLYQTDRPSYQASLPQLKDQALVKQPIGSINLESALKEFV